MSGLSGFNPTGRFTGLASIYAHCRPSYPAEAIDYIVGICRLKQDSLLVDLGCGTGISSRLFAQRGLKVIGLEPNADMRAQAESQPWTAPYAPPQYRRGYAESTGMNAASADAVLAAQAFHWFEAEPALAEFHRILKPSGHLILMWNERDESDQFTEAYGNLIRQYPDTHGIEGPRGKSGNALSQSPIFADTCRINFQNFQILNEDALLGRAFSASYAPREPEQAADYAEKLRQLFSKYNLNGSVKLMYETSVFIASPKA